MNKEEIREKLGKYYLNEEDMKNKDLIIKTINEFINLNPSIKPYGGDFYKDNPFNSHTIMWKFAVKNDIMPLELKIFSSELPTNLINGSYFNSLMIGYDKKRNINKIYIIRNSNEPKEISSRLGLTTLELIYYAFVYRIVDLKTRLRKIKDNKTYLFNNLKPNKIILRYNELNKTINFKLITEAEYDEKTKIFTYKCRENYHQIFNSDKITLKSKGIQTYKIWNYDNLEPLYLSEIIDMDELIPYIKRKILENINKLTNALENIDNAEIILS